MAVFDGVALVVAHDENSFAVDLPVVGWPLPMIDAVSTAAVVEWLVMMLAIVALAGDDESDTYLSHSTPVVVDSPDQIVVPVAAVDCSSLVHYCS